jgi:hypothetical protein
MLFYAGNKLDAVNLQKFTAFFIPAAINGFSSASSIAVAPAARRIALFSRLAAVRPGSISLTSYRKASACIPGLVLAPYQYIQTWRSASFLWHRSACAALK